ncbi:hypothetical protein IWQ57_000679 [Coemansia nantahalensis]|uniref:Uncharacterized protein n=1 Tax=Coemansia nantahalensis TaxID=2789366 RepID=A0ACC1K6T2_9FUNG|nr:hypothetical protein IWQ57_000679 [Coemansia nantahalensis]
MECKLQTLPAHLVRRIACRAAQWTAPDTSDGGVSIGNPVWKMQKYMGLCCGWRASCLPLSCQEVCLAVDRNMQMEERRYWITSILAADACGGHRFARYAHLQLPFYVIVGGHMAGLLAGLRTAFPQVATVQLSIRKGSGDSAEDVDAAIGGFVCAVRRLFPNATTFGVSSSIVFGADEAHMEAHAGRLFSEFLRGAASIQYFSASNCTVDLGLAAAGGLTSIRYTECASADTFVELIRNSAATLQTIHIEANDPRLLVRLVQLPSLDVVEYPALTRLTVGCVDRTGVVSRTALAGAPFPNLRRLALAQAYPFAGDVVFRGNYDRLEHLSLQLDASDVAVLHSQRALARGRLPKVAHLELALVGPWPDAQLAALAAAAPLAAPAVCNLQLCLPLGLPPAAALVPDGSLDKLRYLRVADLPLAAPDVLHLLRRLPALAQLIYEPDTVGEPAQPVADLVARHYPLAPRLRHVVFGMGACASIEHSAQHALLLAVLCPAIACVRWSHTSADFADHCAALMDTDDYAPHADRLQLVDWEKKR